MSPFNLFLEWVDIKIEDVLVLNTLSELKKFESSSFEIVWISFNKLPEFFKLLCESISESILNSSWMESDSFLFFFIFFFFFFMSFDNENVFIYLVIWGLISNRLKSSFSNHSKVKWNYILDFKIKIIKQELSSLLEVRMFWFFIWANFYEVTQGVIRSFL